MCQFVKRARRAPTRPLCETPAPPAKTSAFARLDLPRRGGAEGRWWWWCVHENSRQQAFFSSLFFFKPN